MNPVQISNGKALILYDADCLVQADNSFFDPEQWRARQALTGVATGRGTTFFVRDGDHEWVVRHYRRGGLIAKLIADRYLWRGIEATRAWREWRLLATLYSEGFPVPQPIAARVVRSGLFYRADIVTRRLDATPLSERLQHGRLSNPSWRAIGTTLRRFHDAGVWHADLNAHNILLRDGRVYLLDFDRGRRGKLTSHQAQGNLLRLRRSLDKLNHLHRVFCFDEEDWKALSRGYQGKAEPHHDNSA
ncbi:MAG TPA: 3-deoxy-D-manno-octulosonic acid kinase [Gammaproteobacteria bacterium]